MPKNLIDNELRIAEDFDHIGSIVNGKEKPAKSRLLPNSIVKSATAWPLMVVQGMSDMSNLLSSIAHFESRPENSGRWKTCFKVEFANTRIKWDWEYGMSHLAATMRARANFSNVRYCVSVSVNSFAR
ncbi:hypothetical protein ACLB2K_011775 [Fragaria x ananassa]